MQLTDGQLLQRQQRFGGLYETAYPRLYRYVKFIIWNEADAGDIIGETLLVAYERFDMKMEEEKFAYYLFAIAGNMIRRHNRRNKFRAYFNWQKAEQQAGWQHAEARTDMRELYTLLDQLSLEQRQAIVLYEIAGFSYEEIARLEGCGLGAVKNRILRGRRQIKVMIEQEQKRLEKIQA